MKKGLPNIYKGRSKNINQNQRQTVLNKIEESIVDVNEVDIEKEIGEKPVKKQIRDIFNSPGYVYKADVSIIMESGEELKKTIIGRTNNSLITIDDELIDVSKIIKIDFLN